MPSALLVILAALCFFQPPAAPAPPAAPKAADFLPSRHGFHFRNSFSGQALPKSLRGLGLEKQIKLGDRYGLCGGMSASAADYFLSGTPVPADTTPPKDGTPLYDYIYQRQTDSLGPLAVMAAKFIRWMSLPDRSTAADVESTASLTAAELPSVLSRLSKGELIPLGLVYRAAGPGQKPWENHQVLAFASSADGDLTTIRIYDSNYPNRDDVTIRCTTRPAQPPPGPPREVTCEERLGDHHVIPVRGFFPMPYQPKVPAK